VTAPSAEVLPWEGKDRRCSHSGATPPMTPHSAAVLAHFFCGPEEQACQASTLATATSVAAAAIDDLDDVILIDTRAVDLLLMKVWKALGAQERAKVMRIFEEKARKCLYEIVNFGF